jgi:hypothetical protein
MIVSNSCNSVVIDLQYLPSLEYFACLLSYQNVFLDLDTCYRKQTFHSRCHILTSQGVNRLVVPVCVGKSNLQYRDVRIGDGGRALRAHWNAICTAYGRSGYFSFLKDCFMPFFFGKYKFLVDLNFDLLRVCFSVLGLEQVLNVYDGKTVCANFVGVVVPKKGYAENGIYRPFSYKQVFGTEFVPNLSIVDLLFCQGSNAYSVLLNSVCS